MPCKKMANFYDEIEFDTAKLLKEGAAAQNTKVRSRDSFSVFAYFLCQIKFLYYAFLIKTGLLRRLIYMNVSLGWFDEFKEYWQDCLGGRPLELPDFFYLKGSYRSGAQNLKGWEDSRTVYYLFSWQYKYAFNPIMYKYIRWVKRHDNVLEYGCGMAPIAAALVRFRRHLDIRITCADIPAIWLHFIQWKFRGLGFVRVIPVGQNYKFPPEEKYDIIFCREVLEHLSSPLDTLKQLHGQLNRGGLLIFDFATTEGKGLDRESAMMERPAALEFIQKNFRVIDGKVPSESGAVKFAVCRKG